MSGSRVDGDATRGALEALERAAPASREVTIRRYVLRDVERMGIGALTSYAPGSGTVNWKVAPWPKSAKRGCERLTS